MQLSDLMDAKFQNSLPARQQLRYFRPLVPELLVRLENHLLLQGTDGVLLYVGVQVIVPPISLKMRGRALTFRDTVFRSFH